MSVFGFSVSGNGGENIVPRINYNGKAGRVFRVDRTQTATGWESREEDITNGFKAVCDFDNLEVGWINFDTGGAPDFRLVPMGSAIPAQSSPKHKHGVRFMLKLPSNLANGTPAVREIASTAGVFLQPLEAVVAEWQAKRGENPGKLPIVAITGTKGIKGQHGVNYAPEFQIVGWADRGDLVFVPRATDGAAAPAAASSAPPSTGSTAAPPPRQAPAMADADFG